MEDATTESADTARYEAGFGTGPVLCTFALSFDGRALGAETEWINGCGGSSLAPAGNETVTDSGMMSVKSDPNKIHV